MVDTDKLAALLDEMERQENHEIATGGVEWSDEVRAEWLTERGVVVRPDNHADDCEMVTKYLLTGGPETCTCGVEQVPIEPSEAATEASPFLLAVQSEVNRARGIHAPIHSPHEGYAVILEELDEAKAEIFHNPPDFAAIRKELLQTAAMCQRTVEDVLDRAQFTQETPMTDTTDKLAALLRECPDVWQSRNHVNIARWLTERGVGVREPLKGGPKRAEYEPRTTEQRLAYFTEECGEAIAAAAKSLRWGLDSYNPEPGASTEENGEWLWREIADIEAAIARLQDDPDIAAYRAQFTQETP
jgi:hypothetical protein